MLLRMDVLAGIRDGSIDRAYRRWARPTVRAGGTLTTAVGVLDVLAVEPVDPDALTEQDARRAGEPDLDRLRAALSGERARPVRGRPAIPREGPVWRVDLRFRGEDPRIALRADTSGLDAARAALAKLDRSGAWTRAVLQAIEAEPGRRAPDLAARFGLDTAPFKARVRKLKALGLTESLEVGYRLSPRGEALLASDPEPASDAGDPAGD